MTAPQRELLSERDSRIFHMKQQGHSVPEIAKRFGMSVEATRTALERHLSRLTKANAFAWPEQLTEVLEQLNAHYRGIYPMTQYRLVEMPDGTKVQVEPDPKMVTLALQILDKKSKLLNLEQINAKSNGVGVEQLGLRHELAGLERNAEASTYDPKAAVLQMLELMKQSNMIPEETYKLLLAPEEEALEEVEELNIAEPLELEAGTS